jgi:pseudaminic acid biosynthesis-associated methylase
MTDKTKQMSVWESEFGKEYTERNLLHPPELDALYTRDFGVSRSAMNQAFLSALPRDLRILEVGANVGNQLEALQLMGFTNLYGIELQPYAVEFSKSRTKGVNLIQGSAFDIPFKDRFFDLVFTSGVLIHLAPTDIQKALDEMYRTTRRYIWGMEYYAERYMEVNYRGHEGLLWKTDFPSLFTSRFPDLRVVKRELYPRTGTENVDVMYLLERTGA